MAQKLTTLAGTVTRCNANTGSEPSKRRQLEVPVTCRLDTAEEVSIYSAGGVLQRYAKDLRS